MRKITVTLKKVEGVDMYEVVRVTNSLHWIPGTALTHNKLQQEIRLNQRVEFVITK